MMNGADAQLTKPYKRGVGVSELAYCSGIISNHPRQALCMWQRNPPSAEFSHIIIRPEVVAISFLFGLSSRLLISIQKSFCLKTSGAGNGQEMGERNLFSLVT